MPQKQKEVRIIARHIEGNPGLTKANSAAPSIGRIVAVPDFGEGRELGMTDFNDLHQLVGAEAVRACINTEATSASEMQVVSTDPDEGGTKNQASRLVVFVQDRAELFHDQNKNAFTTDKSTGETRRVDSRAFKDWLLAEFFNVTKKSASDQSLREALSTLSGLARQAGDMQPVSIRVAADEKTYYLDLCEPGKSRVVAIDASGWRVIESPPVKFTRPESMQALPEPERGGDIAELWKVANIPANARILVIAWLCECLRPSGTFPLLELFGEQGSAKSTAQEALRRLIDPNACNLRGSPKDAETIYVTAAVNWLTSYENISHLSAGMQDALCVLATGGGYAKRKLYTDAEESIINVHRPVILNGISASVTAQDLVDRTISIEVPVITERQEESAVWQHFEVHHGRLLGALLTIMTDALRILPNINLPPKDRPRLAGFVRFGMALSAAMGREPEEFLETFNASRVEAVARTIDASPVASVLIDWFEARYQQVAVMPLKSLFEELTERKPIGTDSWPRSPKGLGDALRRANPALRTLGIECRNLGKIGSTVRWSISAVN